MSPVPTWTNATGSARSSAGSTSTAEGILRPDELARHVTLDRTPSAPALSSWVENHWSLRWDLPPGVVHRSATLPHPACHLSVEHGVRREDAPVDAVVVTGVVTRRFEVTLRGAGRVAAVKFRPGGLTALTGVGARALRDRTVGASAVLPPTTCDRLRALDLADSSGVSSESAAAFLAEVLLDEVRGRAVGPAEGAAGGAVPGDPDAGYATVLAVVSAMRADPGLVRVADLEARCEVSGRRLQRLFAHYLGVTPKWVLARYRMHDAVAELDAGYAGSLADLAARHGWFDQAHFTRDFTRLVGEPPGRYQRERARRLGGAGPAQA